jgi:hypothetical protein
MKYIQPLRKPMTEKFLNCSVFHYDCNKVIEGLVRSLKSTGLNPAGLLIMGASGLGKTTAIRLFKEQYSRPATETHSYQTIVPVITPENGTVKSMTCALLKALGCPTPDRGSAHSMFIRAVKLMENLETKIIIFDEIQHLTEKNAQKKTKPVINFVKNLMSETNCPVVLVGMPDAKDLLELDEQIERRFSKTIMLNPFSMNNEKVNHDYTDTDLFFSFLHTIADIMPIDTINIEDPVVAKRILAASKGKISIIIKILEYVIENNEGELATLSDFSRAYSEISDYDIQYCPFIITTKQLEKLYFLEG